MRKAWSQILFRFFSLCGCKPLLLKPHTVWTYEKKMSASIQRRPAAGSPLGGGLGTEKEGRHFMSFRSELCIEVSVIMDMFSVQYGSY